MEVLFQISWIIYNSLDIISVIYVCHTATNEANDFANILHRARTMNRKIKDMIPITSLQTWQTRMQLKIHNTIAMDYTLLHSVIAILSAYLVIFIQLNSYFKLNNATN
ncbi:hypothetical protein CBL_08050 [Carabus blaptoides fortunei]